MNERLYDGYQWPDVFTDPSAPYGPDLTPEDRRISAIADGLVAWANVQCGSFHPNFAHGLIRLAKEAGIEAATEDAFMKAAKEIGASE